ncbi:Imm51 family immunity protein [Catellatospora methionotrophica]|nr:Imm51 family immunity protein [Catellatospora methionotrophica]
MKPLTLMETDPGEFSLLLDTGGLAVDDLIQELGHEPNGYFWEGIAELIVANEAPELDGRVDYDPEAGMFCARSQDRAALEDLGARMSVAATDPGRLRELVALAVATGFEFDD